MGGTVHQATIAALIARGSSTAHELLLGKALQLASGEEEGTLRAPFVPTGTKAGVCMTP